MKLRTLVQGELFQNKYAVRELLSSQNLNAAWEMRPVSTRSVSVFDSTSLCWLLVSLHTLLIVHFLCAFLHLLSWACGTAIAVGLELPWHSVCVCLCKILSMHHIVEAKEWCVTESGGNGFVSPWFPWLPWMSEVSVRSRPFSVISLTNEIMDGWLLISANETTPSHCGLACQILSAVSVSTVQWSGSKGILGDFEFQCHLIFLLPSHFLLGVLSTNVGFPKQLKLTVKQTVCDPPTSDP